MSPADHKGIESKPSGRRAAYILASCALLAVVPAAILISAIYRNFTQALGTLGRPFASVGHINPQTVYDSGGEYSGHRFGLSPDGKHIVYSSPRSGKSRIYVYDVSSKTTHRLTDDAGFDGNPTYSPDGTSILFERESVGHTQIWSTSANGQGQRPLQVTPYDDYLPVVEPGTGKIWFGRSLDGNDHNHLLYRLDPVTGAAERVPADNAGWQVAFSRSRRLVMAPAGKAFGVCISSPDVRKLTEIGDGAEPCISADGARIAYVGTGYGSICLRAAGTGASRVLVSFTTEKSAWPQFSPDGTHILFVRYSNQRRAGDIWEMNLDGTGLKTIISLE